MNYRDYEWELREDRIILDPTLNIDKLGWQAGDYFKVVNTNGQAMLVKVDSLTQLVRKIGEELAE